MHVLGAIAAALVAAVLLLAGLEKLRARRQFRATLDQLEIPAGLAGPLTVAVPALEIGVAVALMAWPSAAVPVAASTGLGVLFAAAGALALTKPRPVLCSCFGSAGSGQLGRRQLSWLPFWIILPLLAYRAHLQWSAEGAVLVMCCVTGALALYQAARLAPAVRRMAGYRQAVEHGNRPRRGIFLPGPASIGEP